MGLKLMAEIGLDGSGFERGLHHIGQEAAASVKNLAVEAFGIYGIEQAIAKTVETATELVNTSKRLDVTVEQLQLLRQAAKDGGTEMGTLASAFEKLDLARAKALSGDKTAIAAFAKLGVSQAQLTTQTAATMFTGSLSTAAKNGNAENLAPAFREVLGKGFGELLPVLRTDFDELGDKMHRLGSIMDTDTAVKLKAIGDSFGLLENVLAVRLGPALITVVEGLLIFIGKIKEVGAFVGALFQDTIPKGFAALFKAVLDAMPKPMQLLMDPTGLGKLITDKISPPAESQKIIDSAGDAANAVADENKKDMDKLRAQLEEIAKGLSNPKPIVPDISDASAVAKSKASRIGSTAADALVRVGNFLGTAGTTISQVDQRKLELMKAHLEQLKAIRQILGGQGNFGDMPGIPVT